MVGLVGHALACVTSVGLCESNVHGRTSTSFFQSKNADSRKARLCADVDVLHFDSDKDELVGLLIKVNGLSMRTNEGPIK